MQIASLKLNFYHQAADNVGLYVITWKKIDTKLLKRIFLKSRQSGISLNKQKFKRLCAILYFEEIVRLFETRVPLL